MPDADVARLACLSSVELPGQVTLCDIGDKIMEEEPGAKRGLSFASPRTGKLYNKKDKEGKKMEKGVAFPTCVSVNEIVGHFSPLRVACRARRLIVVGLRQLYPSF